MPARELEGDAATQRVARHVRAVEPQFAEPALEVGREALRGRLGGLVRGAREAREVDGDDPARAPGPPPPDPTCRGGCRCRAAARAAGRSRGFRRRGPSLRGSLCEVVPVASWVLRGVHSITEGKRSSGGRGRRCSTRRAAPSRRAAEFLRTSGVFRNTLRPSASNVGLAPSRRGKTDVRRPRIQRCCERRAIAPPRRARLRTTTRASNRPPAPLPLGDAVKRRAAHPATSDCPVPSQPPLHSGQPSARKRLAAGECAR